MQNPRDIKTVGAGKGSRPRNNFSKEYRDNYDSIFKKKPSKGSKDVLPLEGSDPHLLDTWRKNIQPAEAFGMESYTLIGSERKLWVHPRTKCAGQHCCIHNPSDHHMKDWPQNWREDRGIMERICPHGIGHPDPDDPKTKNKYEAVHGCDGCCNPKSK